MPYGFLRLLPLYTALGVLIWTPAMATLTMTRTATPSFGTFFGGASGRSFVLGTDGNISGSAAGDYISGASAAVFTVDDTVGSAAITILVDNISALGGLTVNEALCSYNGGAQQRCDSTGISATSVASATLRVGLDVTTSTTHSGGDTASISMNVSVLYQ